MHYRSLLWLGLLMGLTGLARAQAPQAAVTGTRVACTGGAAADFACNGVDLMAFVPRTDLGSTYPVNDIWGWTDPETGTEYALVAKRDGTAFVDLHDPENPRLVGTLPLHAGARASTWRDVKTYRDHAFIVADGAGAHGMQVFDLRQLRTVTGAAVVFSETAHYAGVMSAHNIAINEESGVAYIVGASSGADTCSGGLHMVDIGEPAVPGFIGCFNHLGTSLRGQGYTHDVQCVRYRGPDPDYQGREICVGANETGLSIADVTDKEQGKAVSFAVYPNVQYAHQGWFTEDQRYFVSNDEADETSTGNPTRTLFWDLSDLDDPVLLHEYAGTTKSTDHNLYIRGKYAFLANYTSGLCILDISDVTNPREVAFFDTFPSNDNAGFAGAWSSYPFFRSGNIVVSSEGEGLFVLRPLGLDLTPTTTEAHDLPEDFAFEPAFPNPFSAQTTLTLRANRTQQATVVVYDLMGRSVARLFEGMIRGGEAVELTFDAAELPGGTYIVAATGDSFSASRRLTLVR
jgi:choice-of-anchor B domain-containing protein